MNPTVQPQADSQPWQNQYTLITTKRTLMPRINCMTFSSARKSSCCCMVLVLVPQDKMG